MKITTKQLKKIIREQLEESQTLSKEDAMEKLQQAFPEVDFEKILHKYKNYGYGGHGNPTGLAIRPLQDMAWNEFLNNHGLTNEEFSSLLDAFLKF